MIHRKFCLSKKKVFRKLPVQKTSCLSPCCYFAVCLKKEDAPQFYNSQFWAPGSQILTLLNFHDYRGFPLKRHVCATFEYNLRIKQRLIQYLQEKLSSNKRFIIHVLSKRCSSKLDISTKAVLCRNSQVRISKWTIYQRTIEMHIILLNQLIQDANMGFKKPAHNSAESFDSRCKVGFKKPAHNSAESVEHFKVQSGIQVVSEH